MAIILPGLPLFAELLVIFSVSIFALVLFLLLMYEKSSRDLAQIYIRLNLSKYGTFLRNIHYILVLIFIIITFYSVWVGSRPSAYFVVLSLVFLSSATLFLSDVSPKKTRVIRAVLVTLVIVGLSQALIPAMQNRLMISNSDQWGNAYAAGLIVDSGSFLPAATASTGYYSSIPLFVVLVAAVNLLTGSVYLSYLALAGTITIVMVFSIYLIIQKLTSNHVACIAGVFAFVSIPRLAMDYALPSTVSLALGAILVFILISQFLGPKRRSLLIILLISFSTLIFHPSGILVLVMLCGGFLIAFVARIVKRSFPEATIILGLLILVGILSFTYWSMNETVLTSIVSPIEKLITSIQSSVVTPSSATYLPRYFLTGQEIYSFAWALPVGVSAAYVVSVLYTMFNKKANRPPRRGILENFAFISGVLGIALIFSAFISVINYPTGAIERYANQMAYFLLLLPTSAVCSLLISKKRKIGTAVIVTLLLAFVIIGSSSPDWAPSENIAFTTAHSTYDSQVEAQTIVRWLPSNITVYDDYDISVGGAYSLARLQAAGSAGTNQITANLIGVIKDGSFVLPDLIPVNEFYIIKSSEIQNYTAVDKYFGICYDSGRHYLMITPHGLYK